jgi:acyl-[acyl-carrier-protein]-phospholipid O-acyltransferase/long-chain-fatty-acid--[acyl-carrier-protein] ligase
MLRPFLRSVLRLVALRLLRVRASYSPASIELLRQGRAIVCANHVSLLDGVIVALASPVPLTFGVDTDFSRRSRLASRGMAALAWLGFGAVVLKALDRGETVMVFPEGRISETGRPLPDQPGMAWLVRRAGAPVLRVRIRGAERSRFFAKAGKHFWPRIEVEF